MLIINNYIIVHARNFNFLRNVTQTSQNYVRVKQERILTPWCEVLLEKLTSLCS
jgi:hypothetical protein